MGEGQEEEGMKAKKDIYAPVKTTKTPCNVCMRKGIDNDWLIKNAIRWKDDKDGKVSVLSCETVIDNYLDGLINNRKVNPKHMEKAIDRLKEWVEGENPLPSLRANRVLQKAINEWRQKHVTVTVSVSPYVMDRVKKIMEQDGKGEVIDAELNRDEVERSERPLLLS